MTVKPGFVFDTNVLISAALLKQSISRTALDKALDEGEILASIETVNELNSVLGREKFSRYITTTERFQFLAMYLKETRQIKIETHISDCRDPRDNKFLELAVSGQANCIISGDQDLLVLHPFRGIKIITPREFVERKW